MELSKLINKFCEKSPISAMSRGLLENVLTAERLDTIFDVAAEGQYTRNLLFSTVFGLMTLVVTRVFPSVKAAYQSEKEDINTSLTSVYNKINGFDTQLSETLVRETAQDLKTIVDEMQGCASPLLPGYRLKLLDGNCIEPTDRRLKVLRHTGAQALPGKLLVVYEPEYQMATEIVAIEDGHAQERSAFDALLPTVEGNDVYVMDRNFCTQQFLDDLASKDAYYVVRHHGKMPYEDINTEKKVGEIETGTVYEQWIAIKSGENLQDKRKVRRIRIKLKKVTRNGDENLYIITNLTKNAADARKIASLYRHRWKIETIFQELESYLESEVNGLGYPKAAIFGFSVAVVAYNLMSTIKAALRSSYGEEKVENEVSGYYIAGELARTREGMELLIEPEEWEPFQRLTAAAMAKKLLTLAKSVKLSKYKKAKRGPQKVSNREKPSKKEPHVSTARLLNA